MIAAFKSNFSIGKSILTLDPAVDKEGKSLDIYPDGPKSIFSILKEENLSELILLDDTFYGFYSAYKYCMDSKINLIYGINMPFAEEDSDSSAKCKISVFIKNKHGYQDLIKLHSRIGENGYLRKADLETLFTKNLVMAMPFYDSFIYFNCMTFAKFSDFLLKFEPTFFVEDNQLPFDNIVRKGVEGIVAGKFPIIEAKTICYYKRADIDSFLTYKCICNRSFGKRSLSKPNFDHFASNEFCWESYKEKNK